MKKAFLWLLGLIIVAGVGIGGWYLGTKYVGKEDNKTEEKSTSKKETELKVEYTTEKYEKSTDNKGLVISNSVTRPKSINRDSGDKIISTLDEYIDERWDSIVERTDKDIENYDPDFQFDAKYGIEYMTTHYANKNVIQFTFTSSGSMGGVGWNEYYIYNFNLESGKLLELKDICVDVTECKTFMKDYFLKVLQRDERFNNLDENYEEDMEVIYDVSNFGFTKNGFELIVPEYEISDGAAGAFIYTIPYDEFNKYLKEEYQM